MVRISDSKHTILEQILKTYLEKLYEFDDIVINFHWRILINEFNKDGIYKLIATGKDR